MSALAGPRYLEARELLAPAMDAGGEDAAPPLLHLAPHLHPRAGGGPPTMLEGQEVWRGAIDRGQHDGSSLPKTAAGVRSLVRRQERWLLWRPWALRR